MITIRVNNVHEALPVALDALLYRGVRRDSRNGPVFQFAEPVTTVYLKPAERVLFHPERDANPFFHFFESLWMLNGQNDVEPVAAFVENMRNFSDDGVTFHGAYGHRWREWFDRDQLTLIIDALRADPTDRRQVLSMWDTNADLGRKGKDLPCNLQAVFQIAPDGRLDMMVTNRSNDLIWGAYGANAVHFSFLHEFMARAIGVEQGIYRQVSANLHAYDNELLARVKPLANLIDPVMRNLPPGYYFKTSPMAYRGEPQPIMVGNDYRAWLAELNMLMHDLDAIGFRQPFFRRVALPILHAHRTYKETKGSDRFDAARAILRDCAATDWKLACEQWLDRREAAAAKRRARAVDDGVHYDG